MALLALACGPREQAPSGEGVAYVEGVVELRGQGDREGLKFGRSIAVGDFDADGAHDLAVGAVNCRVGECSDVGKGLVRVYYGADLAGDLQSPPCDEAEGRDDGSQWGWSLAAVDYDGDGDDDLLVGAPGDSTVSLYDGSTRGLSLQEPSWMLWGDPEEGLGSSVAVGDTDGDGEPEIVVGSSRYDGVTEAGDVLEGSGRVQVLDLVRSSPVRGTGGRVPG